MTARHMVAGESRGEWAIEQLTALGSDRYWIVSCYLPLTRDARFRRGYVVELKNLIRAAREGLPAKATDGETRAGIERDLDRILEAVADPARLPRTPGAGIFACRALDLFLVVPLPRVRRPRLVIDRAPHLHEVRAAEYEFGRILTAVVDRVQARIFQVDAHGVVELPGIAPSAGRGGRFHDNRQDLPGWGEKEYHHRIEHEREQHYAAVIRRLTELDHKNAPRGLVIAGPKRDTSGLINLLDAGLRDRLIGTARLNPGTTSATDVQRVTLELSDEDQLRSERAEMEAFLEGVEKGWAVNGVRATVEALKLGQLRALFVRAETDAAEAEEAIEEAFGQGVRVIMVHAAEVAAKLAHLGGLRRSG